MPTDDVRFAGPPTAFVFDAPDGKKVQHLLWGDFVRLLGAKQGGWVEVRARAQNGWMKETDLQKTRLLEVNFVDIGQGDGSFIVTPNDNFLVIDAGESDNMYRFLRWRFNVRSHPDDEIAFDAAIITHPDSDHYKGFQQLIDSPNFRFDRVYHNGIVERVGDDALGEKVKHGKLSFVPVARDDAALQEIIGRPELVGKKLYPRLMRSAANSARVGQVRMLSVEDKFVEGYDGSSGSELSLEVLGPIPESVNGAQRLRWFGDVGKTKNGHSVVLKLRYKQVRILLGGDLNIPSEHYLLSHYTGLDAEKPNAHDREEIVARARKVFEADVAKACHHGSADFTSLYLRAVNPIATVISSGDGEPHCHPRPDALGTFGKHGRGERPLIFSTELARSSRETIKEPNRLRAEIRALMEKRDLETDDDKRAALQERINEKLGALERSVAVYGMITLRSDGNDVLIAQKLEEPRPNTGEKWDVHLLKRDSASGELRYVAKHAD